MYIYLFLYGGSRDNPDDSNRECWKHFGSRDNKDVPITYIMYRHS